MSNSVNYKTAYGKNQPLIDVFNAPIVALRSPGVNDKAEKGQLWVNQTTNAVWMLTSFVGGNAIWTELDNNGGGGGVMTWSTEVAAAVNLANNHGYINGNAGLTTFTLPLIAPIGSTYIILGQGAGGWTIAQNAGQRVQLGAVLTTAGIAGSTSSAHSYAAATVICRVANTIFDVVTTTDNLNLV